MDDFKQRSDSFMEWLSSLPGVTINPKIKIDDLRGRGAGRGVVAVEDIEPEDDELFTIPRSCVLSTENSDLPSRLPELFEDLDPWLALVLVLMYEYFKSDSYWNHYFDVLPEEFDTLMFWNSTELDALQASAVINKIGRDRAEALFKSVVLPAVRNNGHVFYDAGGRTYSDDELMLLAHRMASIVMAYAFDLEKDESDLQPDEDGYATDEDEDSLLKGMVPLADILNADVHNNARLYQYEGFLCMKSLCRIQKGDEILNDYGPLPRSDLLRRYGYLTTAYSKFDVVEVSQSLLDEMIQGVRRLDKEDLEKRLTYLEDIDVLDDAFLFSRRGEGIFTPSLETYTMTLLAGRNEYQQLENLVPLRKEKLRLEFAQVMKKVAEARLAQYSTTISQDRSFLREPDMPLRRRMAIEVRLGEKEILQDARTYASEYLQDVKTGSDGPNVKRQRTKEG